MTEKLRTEIPVELAFPVAVKAADGKDATRGTIVIKRPKTRHAKRLALLIGADLMSELVEQLPEGVEAKDAKVDGRQLVVDLLPKLMTAERLDGLTALIADMCNEDVAVIDDIDLVDLVVVGKAFLDFFPALRSAPPAS